ncbi:MAG: cell division protein FtsW, partial [Candidatus Magasanikbacteria bacterium CG10_big_fil_rev_8_21_14_0_10_43_9]
FGLVMLSSAGSELGKIRFNDSYYYLKHQVLNGLIAGLLGFFVTYKIRYQHYKKFALLLLIGTFILLGLIFTNFGSTAGGATRWLVFGPLSFQPSELLKLTFIIYLAAWLSNEEERRGQSLLRGFLPLLVMIGIMAVLLLKQPATSMVVILVLAALIVYFVSGAKLRYLAAFGL